MFNLNQKPMINPELSKYVKQKTLDMQHKLIQKYSMNTNRQSISNLLTDGHTLPDNVSLLPFVSLMSFLAGCSFSNSIVSFPLVGLISFLAGYSFPNSIL